MRRGPTDSITDVIGLCVGNAHDVRLASGVTVLTANAPLRAGVHIMGGAPGTRETELLAPDRLVRTVDAICLAGGSAYGLAACDGVMAGLRADGLGFRVGPALVPIVPGAILFDLANGGDKEWDRNPYPVLGRTAYDRADTVVANGSHGAGYGATAADLPGGLGTASVLLDDGIVVAALVAVNALGRVCDAEGRFYAADHGWNGEYGAPGIRQPSIELETDMSAGQSTTIGIVATTVALDQAGLTRIATAAHDGYARAITPSHTPFDGDLIFAVSPETNPTAAVVDATIQARVGHAAANCVARAIVHAVATAAGRAATSSWSERYGPGFRRE